MGLKEQIAREIEAYKRRNSGPLDWPYLNNFHCRLPGGLYRTMYDQATMNRPNANIRASLKLRGMTHAQFFNLIDGFIVELGLDAKRIRKLQRFSPWSFASIRSVV